MLAAASGLPAYGGRMATPPAGQSPPPMRESHRYRQVAETFGTDAERYDRTRPRYPDALVERIVAEAPGPDLLDVGCGTGIEARQFQAAGCTVLGVEPDGRMADFARRAGVEVEVATFEAWDRPNTGEHDDTPPGEPREGCSRRAHEGGGGGNRTRVLQYLTRASPGAACCGFLSPGGHAGKPPTGLSRC